MLERELKRYAAYFKGWCQAFGEHESIPGADGGISWLLAENQAGFVLPPTVIKPLYREILLHRHVPTLTISRDHVEIGSLQFPLALRHEQRALDAIANILDAGNEGHLFLTSHLMYGTGARIMTFSSKKPVAIIYKEIGTLNMKMV